MKLSGTSNKEEVLGRRNVSIKRCVSYGGET